MRLRDPDFWEWCRYCVFATFVVVFLARSVAWAL